MTIENKLNESEEEINFAGIKINNYLSSTKEVKNIIEKGNLLKKLREDNLSLGKEGLGALEEEIISYYYPEIDLSFLGMNGKIAKAKKFEQTLPFYSLRSILTPPFCFSHPGATGSWKEKNILVPKFGVFSLDNGKVFNIRYSLWNKNIVEVNFFNSSIRSLEKFDCNKKSLIEFAPYLIKTYGEKGWNVGIKKDHVDRNCYVFQTKLACESQNYSHTIFQTSFNGFIPDKVKRRINNSKDYFRNNEVYIISEIREEDLNEANYEVECLAIGLKKKKFYLINSSSKKD